MNRRELLLVLGAGVAGHALTGVAGCQNTLPEQRAYSRKPEPETGDWDLVRASFRLDPDYIHMAGLLIASHPAPVREAIEEHRRALDENPALYVRKNKTPREREVRKAAAEYMGVGAKDIALTHSTTEGVALAVNGLQIREDQEMLTSRFDYYSTHASLLFKERRTGALVRKIELYRDIQKVSADEIVDTLIGAVGPKTRLVTATWVHSATGLKVPVSRIAARLAEINKDRSPKDRALLLVDGVHGLGVENTSVVDLGCDFFAAGTHKWMFAPRGTGILWGNPGAQEFVTPTIPTFSRDEGWGPEMTPGGFQAFEHQWAMEQAFWFHQKLDRVRVAERIHVLNRQCKEGLAQWKHVRLYTPLTQHLSSGIVCFDIDGMTPRQVVARLREHKIIASTTPYSPSHARLTPGLLNTPQEVEKTLDAIRALV